MLVSLAVPYPDRGSGARGAGPRPPAPAAPTGVRVGVPATGLTWLTAVRVGVGVPTTVGVLVGVCVGVRVGVSVRVGVCVGVFVGVFVGQMPFGHGVGVTVGVGVRDGVGVDVGVRVNVGVGVGVGVNVGVGVGVAPPAPHVTVASTSVVGMFTAFSSKIVVPATGSSLTPTRCSGTTPSALHWNVMMSMSPVAVDVWNAHPPFRSGGSSFKNQNDAGWHTPPDAMLTTVSFAGSYRNFMFHPAQ